MRGVAVFTMFTQHCMIIHERSGGEGGSLAAGLFVLLGTAPAAPVFLLLMGYLQADSRRSPPEELSGGLKLLLLGYLLNFLRLTLPLLLFSSPDRAAVAGGTPLELFLAVDILQTAGLARMTLGLLRRLPGRLLLSSVLIPTVLLISPFLWSLPAGPVRDLFWGSGENVFFPYFPWIIYPLAGMILKELLNRRIFIKMRSRIAAGTGLMLSGLILMNFMPSGDYYRSCLPVHLFILGFLLLWHQAWELFAHVRGIPPARRLLQFWSLNVTAVYFVQWVLFGWSILLFGYREQNAGTAALIGLAILILTTFSVALTRRIRRNISNPAFPGLC